MVQLAIRKGFLYICELSIKLHIHSYRIRGLHVCFEATALGCSMKGVLGDNEVDAISLNSDEFAFVSVVVHEKKNLS